MYEPNVNQDGGSTEDLLAGGSSVGAASSIPPGARGEPDEVAAAAGATPVAAPGNPRASPSELSGDHLFDWGTDEENVGPNSVVANADVRPPGGRARGPRHRGRCD